MNKFQKRCAKNKTKCLKARCKAAKYCGDCSKYCKTHKRKNQKVIKTLKR